MKQNVTIVSVIMTENPNDSEPSIDRLTRVNNCNLLYSNKNFLRISFLFFAIFFFLILALLYNEI